jgi:tetratricopeptide (TPR) repeat protein
MLFATLVQSQPVRQSGSTDLASAEDSLAQLVKTQPSAQNWERLGLVRHLQNKYDSAIPALREAVRLDPKRWTSHLFLGICLYRTNQFPAALTSLQQAERFAPAEGAGRDDLDFWFGATQIALKKNLEGLARLERLLQRSPRHADSLELVVRTAADASTAAWNHVAETAFETAAGYEVHGHALESEGNRAGALEAFRRSSEIAPARAGPGLALGRLLLLEGKAAEALQALRREIALPACDPAAFYYAGLAAVQTGNYAEAAPWLEYASRWPVRNPEAPLALAQVYLSVGKPEEAVKAARQAISQMPASPAAHELLIAALIKAGYAEEAEAERRRHSGR